jgi:hypothetical protein
MVINVTVGTVPDSSLADEQVSQVSLLGLETSLYTPAAVATAHCNNMGCLWEETNCSLEPGNPNDCPVACYFIEGLECQATSMEDCDVGIC